MPDTYTITVDGTDYDVEWSKPNPPGKSDWDGIASGIRGQGKATNQASAMSASAGAGAAAGFAPAPTPAQKPKPTPSLQGIPAAQTRQTVSQALNLPTPQAPAYTPPINLSAPNAPIGMPPPPAGYTPTRPLIPNDPNRLKSIPIGRAKAGETPAPEVLQKAFQGISQNWALPGVFGEELGLEPSRKPVTMADLDRAVDLSKEIQAQDLGKKYGVAGAVLQGTEQFAQGLLKPSNIALGAVLGPAGEINSGIHAATAAGFGTSMLGEGLKTASEGEAENNPQKMTEGILSAFLGGLVLPQAKAAVVRLEDSAGNPVPARMHSDGQNVTVQVPKRGDTPGFKQTVAASEIPGLLQQNGLATPKPAPVVNVDLSGMKPGQKVTAADGTPLRLLGPGKVADTVRVRVEDPQSDRNMRVYEVPKTPAPETIVSETPPQTPVVTSGEANPATPPITQTTPETPAHDPIGEQFQRNADEALARWKARDAEQRAAAEQRAQVPAVVAPPVESSTTSTNPFANRVSQTEGVGGVETKAHFDAHPVPMNDIRGNATGWLKADTENGILLYDPSTNKTVRFDANDPRNGSDKQRAQAMAQAYAIDNPISRQPIPEGELVTQPIFTQKAEPSAVAPVSEFSKNEANSLNPANQWETIRDAINSKYAIADALSGGRYRTSDGTVYTSDATLTAARQKTLLNAAIKDAQDRGIKAWSTKPGVISLTSGLPGMDAQYNLSVDAYAQDPIGAIEKARNADAEYEKAPPNPNETPKPAEVTAPEVKTAPVEAKPTETVKPTEFKRTTPARDTPERAKLEQRHKELSDQLADINKQYQDLIAQSRKLRSDKSIKANRAEREGLQATARPLQAEGGKLEEQLRQAQKEDAIENAPDEASRLRSQMEADPNSPDATAWLARLEQLVKAEAGKYDFSPEDRAKIENYVVAHGSTYETLAGVMKKQAKAQGVINQVRELPNLTDADKAFHEQRLRQGDPSVTLERIQEQDRQAGENAAKKRADEEMTRKAAEENAAIKEKGVVHLQALNEEVKPTAEESERIAASAKTEKLKPATGLTPTQETFLAGRLKYAAKRMIDLNAEEGTAHDLGKVRIEVPGDGAYTVETLQQINGLHSALTGEPAVEGMRTDIKRATPSLPSDHQSLESLVRNPGHPEATKTQGFLEATVDGKTFTGEGEAESAYAASKATKKSVGDKLQQAADDASARLAKKTGNLNAFVDPQDFIDAATIGANFLYKGTVKFAEWSKAMVETFGEVVKPHLERLFADAQKIHEEAVPKTIVSEQPATGQDVVAPTPKPATEPTTEAGNALPETTAGKNAPIPETVPQEVTGAKNAITETERAERGMSPVERQEYTTLQQSRDLGRAAIESGKVNPVTLAQEVAGKPRPLTAEQVGALADHRAILKDTYDKTGTQLDQAIKDGDRSRIAQLQQDYEVTRNLLDMNDQALVKGGREQSAAFLARKMIKTTVNQASRADVVAQATRLRGEPLPEAVRTDLEAKADAYKAELASKPVTEVRQQQNRAAQQVKPLPSDFGIENKVFTADKAAEARTRIAEKLKKVGVQSDPFGAQTAGHLASLIPDLVEVGGYYLEGGIRKFGDWVARMRVDAPGLDDATAQHVWSQVKAEAQGETTNRIPEPSNFVEMLAKRMSWQKAAAFVEMIADADGAPRILDKLIAGDPLTPAEKVTVKQAYEANAPTRTTTPKSPATDAVAAVMEAVNEGRQRSSPQRVADIQAKIDDIREQLKSGNLKPVEGRKPGTLSPKQQELAELQKQLQQERRFQNPPQVTAKEIEQFKGDPGPAQEAKARQRQIDELQRTAAELQKALSSPEELKKYEAAREQTRAERKAKAEAVPPEVQAWRQRVADKRVAVDRAIAAQQPVSFMDKLTTVWRAGLLSSFRTMGKIVAAHGTFLAAEEMAHIPASLVDTLYSSVTGKDRQVGGASVAGMAAAAKKAATQGVKDWATIMGKGEDTLRAQQEEAGDTSPIAQMTKGADIPHQEFHSGNPILDAYVNGVYRMHGSTYHTMKTYALTRALYEQASLLAKGDKAKLADLMQNPSDTMVTNAIAAAEEATFINNNQAAKMVSNARSAGPVAKVIVDAVVPFPKVPSNVIARAVDYTGLPFTVYDAPKMALDTLRKADITPEQQRRFAMSAGRGVTGAAVIALGYTLASKGVLRGNMETQKQREKSTAEGTPGGSIMLGGQWRKVDDIAPDGTLLTLGANLYDARNPNPDDRPSQQHNIGEALVSFLAEQPLLQGVKTVNDAEDAYRKSGTGSAVTSVIGGKLGSAIPTISADIAATGDIKRAKESPLDYLKERIPIARQTLPPKVDKYRQGIPEPWKVIDFLQSTRPGSNKPLTPEEQKKADALEERKAAAKPPPAVRPKMSETQKENNKIYRDAIPNIKVPAGYTTRGKR